MGEIVRYVMSQWLDRETFKTIIDTMPLVSIDLLVRNAQGQILVGKRVNRPAQGYWFVPGGRILKNERLAEAFSRLTEDELGLRLDIRNARYLGLYEHFYDDSIFTDDEADVSISGVSTNDVSINDVSTHYVVNGFELVLPESHVNLPCEQHNEYRWLSEEEFKTSDEVHVHSRWYVDNAKGFRPVDSHE